jgi:hypothetical protein
MVVRLLRINAAPENYTVVLRADDLQELTHFVKRFRPAERVSVRHRPAPEPVSPSIDRHLLRAGLSSVGLTIPKEYAQQLEIEPGGAVKLWLAEGGCIVIRPLHGPASHPVTNGARARSFDRPVEAPA